MGLVRLPSGASSEVSGSARIEPSLTRETGA